MGLGTMSLTFRIYEQSFERHIAHPESCSTHPHGRPHFGPVIDPKESAVNWNS